MTKGIRPANFRLGKMLLEEFLPGRVALVSGLPVNTALIHTLDKYNPKLTDSTHYDISFLQ